MAPVAPSPRGFLWLARLVSVLACGPLFTAAAAEIVLYETGFSDFPVGDGELVGHDGWSSTHPDEIVHGIVADIFEEGDRSGSLGFHIPETDDVFITVFRPIPYDPIDEGMPLIEFTANIAIIDSQETNFYDSFYISVFNTNAEVLASLIFDNTEEAFGIWRSDGLQSFDTEIGFEHDVLYGLRITVNYAENTWTAVLGDTTLFTDATFSGSDARGDLGDFAAEWEITDADNPGDNWLLFDDWTVKALDPDGSGNGSQELFVVMDVDRRENGDVILRWTAEPETSYRVESSERMRAWTALPNGLITTDEGEETASYVDQTAGAAAMRFYRIRRLQ